MLHVAKSIATGVNSIVDQLQSKSYAIVDDISHLYRNKAEKMQSKMVPSQSKRWDEASVPPYLKLSYYMLHREPETPSKETEDAAAKKAEAPTTAKRSSSAK